MKAGCVMSDHGPVHINGAHGWLFGTNMTVTAAPTGTMLAHRNTNRIVHRQPAVNCAVHAYSN